VTGRRRLGAALAAGIAWGCASAAPDGRAVRALGPLPEPPTAKQALEVVFRHQDVPLTVDPSCRGAGTLPADATLGEYASGFLAELVGGTNEVLASCAEGDRLGGAVASWRCDVEWRHRDGEDEWSWGVRFALRAADGEMVPGSLRCIGSG
jgi:hypothetical protein